MTLEPRDLTERRVHEISVWLNTHESMYSNILPGEDLSPIAESIIAADPATTELANARELLLAYDAKVDGLNALLDRAAEVLKEHHLWHLNYGEVNLEIEQGKPPILINNSAEYCDSAMYGRTSALLTDINAARGG